MDFKTVYAEFNTVTETEKVKSLSRYLRENVGLRVSHHTPWQARDRQNALESKAKAFRDMKYKTRINIKDNDYVLSVNSKEDNRGWRIISEMEDIPAFCIQATGRFAEKSPSKAKGREGITATNKHPISPDQTGESPPVKKQSEDEPDNAEELLEEEEEVEQTIGDTGSTLKKRTQSQTQTRV